MAKSLVFRWNGSELSSEINRVDRSKLYGYKETEVVDEAGDLCEIATLAADGQTLIGKGGTGIGYVTVEGNWCDRGSLRPVGIDGIPIEAVKSSFQEPIELAETVTVDEFLDYDVRAVYHMPELELEGDDSLCATLRSGTIYRFAFSYRGGIEAEPAFLMANADGEVFMLIGRATQIEYLSLPQTATVADDSDGDDDDVDAMDFDMI
jgi:hypothetical protein